MSTKRIPFAIDSDRDAVLAGSVASFASGEPLRPSHNAAVPDRPIRIAALAASPPVAEDDVDRATSGVATGNVISGAGTLSGTGGKDHGGSGALSLNGGTVTQNGTYGDITFDGKGNYTYTRTAPIDALPIGATDVFGYAVTDSKGNVSTTASLRVLLDPLITSPAPPPGTKSAVVEGTNYDEIIYSHTPTTYASFPATVAGLGGDDIIRNVIDAHDVVLDGGAGNDVLIGGIGRDTLMGGPGADKLDGGGYLNYASYATSTTDVVASLLTLLGTAGDALGDEFINIYGLIGGKGNDQLVGSDAVNSLLGREGNDLLQGFGDSDEMSGQAGKDALFGGDGNDRLSGGEGDDALHGEIGNDTFLGDPGADLMDGGADTDKVDYSLSAKGIVLDIDHPTKSVGDAKGDTFIAIETIIGSRVNDTLIAGAAAIVLHGDSGDDKIIGGVGADSLFGDSGNDMLLGGDGSDSLDGGIDQDVLDGGSGTDTLFGGAGNDVLMGGADADSLDGGADIDQVSYANAKEAVEFTLDGGGVLGDALGDTYANIEIAIGSAFNDSIFGGNFKNTLFGGAGDDALFGGSLDDTLHGGAGGDLNDGGGGGIDTASYSDGKAVTVNLTDTLKSTGDATGDTYLLIDIIEGSGFADTLIGDADANTFSGIAGNDKMRGGDGGDRLNGDAGNDTLLGENDSDILSGGANDDKLDGGSGDDVLYGNTSALDFDQGKDTLLGGEGDDQLSGGTGDDKLDGGIGEDQLQGGAGKDTLIGGAGDDVLIGGSGNDSLTGGAGADRFTYSGFSSDGTDKVTDFNAAEDFLHFTNVFSGSGDDIQDLAEAGYTAVSSGSTLTISQNGAVAMVISGWKGGEVAGDIQTVALILGSHLDVH